VTDGVFTAGNNIEGTLSAICLGSPFKEGDTIGMGYDRFLHRIFYTRNGKFRGKYRRCFPCFLHAELEMGFEDFEGHSSLGDLVACFSLRYPGEEICANFRGNFQFNLENFELALNREFCGHLSLAPFQNGLALFSLVEDHLEFFGYQNTLSTLREKWPFRLRDTSMLETRQKIRHAILSRNSKEAQHLVKHLARRESTFCRSVEILLACQEWIDFFSTWPEQDSLDRYFIGDFLPTIRPLFHSSPSPDEKDYIEVIHA
jgi:hypothetical protein